MRNLILVIMAVIVCLPNLAFAEEQIAILDAEFTQISDINKSEMMDVSVDIRSLEDLTQYEAKFYKDSSCTESFQNTNFSIGKCEDRGGSIRCVYADQDFGVEGQSGEVVTFPVYIQLVHVANQTASNCFGKTISFKIKGFATPAFSINPRIFKKQIPEQADLTLLSLSLTGNSELSEFLASPNPRMLIYIGNDSCSGESTVASDDFNVSNVQDYNGNKLITELSPRTLINISASPIGNLLSSLSMNGKCYSFTVQR
jgi:hypothetical protein